jgi:hypothetical protein
LRLLAVDSETLGLVFDALSILFLSFAVSILPFPLLAEFLLVQSLLSLLLLVESLHLASILLLVPLARLFIGLHAILTLSLMSFVSSSAVVLGPASVLLFLSAVLFGSIEIFLLLLGSTALLPLDVVFASVLSSVGVHQAFQSAESVCFCLLFCLVFFFLVLSPLLLAFFVLLLLLALPLPLELALFLLVSSGCSLLFARALHLRADKLVGPLLPLKKHLLALLERFAILFHLLGTAFGHPLPFLLLSPFKFFVVLHRFFFLTLMLLALEVPLPLGLESPLVAILGRHAGLFLCSEPGSFLTRSLSLSLLCLLPHLLGESILATFTFPHHSFADGLW